MKKPQQLPPVHIQPPPNIPIIDPKTLEEKITKFKVNPVRQQSRISIFQQFVHQVSGEKPLAVEIRASLNVKSTDQPFQRRIELTDEWTNIDTGWIDSDKLYMLIIENRGMVRKNQGIPTKEEKEEIESRIVEISISEGIEHQRVSDLIIPINCSLPIFPEELSTWMVRCRKGSCRVIVTALPR